MFGQHLKNVGVPWYTEPQRRFREHLRRKWALTKAVWPRRLEPSSIPEGSLFCFKSSISQWEEGSPDPLSISPWGLGELQKETGSDSHLGHLCYLAVIPSLLNTHCSWACFSAAVFLNWFKGKIILECFLV